MWGLIRGGGTLYSRRRAPQPEGGVVAFIDLDLDWVEDLDSVVTGFVDVNLDPAVDTWGVLMVVGYLYLMRLFVRDLRPISMVNRGLFDTVA